MCLKTNQSKPYIATKDFTVCKILKLKDEHILTPVQDAPAGNIPGLMETTPKTELRRSVVHSNKYLIDVGYIHSFTEIQLAYMLAQGTVYSDDCIAYMVEAVIPKGAKFFIGDIHDVCSNKLFLKEIVCTITRSNRVCDDLRDLQGKMTTPTEMIENSIECIDNVESTDEITVKDGVELIISTLVINGITYYKVPICYL